MLFLFNLIKNFILYDPLEQFDVIPLTSGISISNLIIFTLINLVLIFILYFSTTKYWTISRWSTVSWWGTSIHSFVYNIVRANVLLPQQFLYAIIFFAFLFILGANLLGLVPFSYTVTSSFVVTLFFSLTLFIIINILAIYRQGLLPFVGMFIPGGTPMLIAPLLVLIELVSYFARLSSLAIRLFANMMAGHTLLKILIGFSFSILMSFTQWVPLAIFPWIVVILIVVLEILISMLQAYVFIILICIYINDAVLSH